MSNCGLNLSSLSTPKPTVQSEDLLHAVNYTLDRFLNTNCYDSIYFTQNQISPLTSTENDSKMQSENIILSEINSGLWDKATISAISLLTQQSYPHYIISQKFFNYIFNVKPNYNFSLVKEFFMKLLLSHPPTTNMIDYYMEILCGKYITINGKTPEDKGLIVSVIEMLINLLKSPEKFQPECDSDLTQEEQIIEVTKNFNDIVLNNSLLISQNDKTLMSYNELSWSEKMKRCTIALKIIYEILETNYTLCSKNVISELLIFKIFWPDIKSLGFVNKEMNKVLTLYRLSFQLGETNFHLIKTTSELVNLIGEALRECDKNEGIKYPYFGMKSSNFARELSHGLFEHFEKFGETCELILSLMPPWLRLLFCANLLNFLTEYQCSPELVGVCDILEYITSGGSKSKEQPKQPEGQASIDTRIVKKLKKLKSINGRNAKGETPLLLACSKNNSEEVKALLTFPELDVNGTDDEGWTALHLAAFKGHVACVEELLKFHPKKSLQRPVNTRARGPNNTTPLMCGATQGHVEVCRLLLDHSGSVLLEDINESNQTPLELSNNPEIRKILKHYKDNNITGQEKNNSINIRQKHKESVCRICVEMIQAYFSTHRTWDVYKKLKKLKENNSEEIQLSSVEVISTVDYIRYHRDIKTNICKLRRLVPKLENVKEFSCCFQFYTEILNSNK